MFPPLFPIYIQQLEPLHSYAPFVWLAGIFCLWLTRYTHQLGRLWGGLYYGASAVLRPAGIILVAVGWLALYAPRMTGGGVPAGRRLGVLPRGAPTEWLILLAILAFFALGLWAVATLGIRQSFLFRRLEDSLVARGPYALVRHPQFLSAVGITFFGVILYDPRINPIADPWAYENALLVNWVLFTVALWALAVLEDRELLTHFGEEYAEYARRVPRLIPN